MSKVADIREFVERNPELPLEDHRTLLAEIDRMRDIAKLGLSFAPRGSVEPGLAPMFYHTLTFEGDAKLQERIDEARKALEDA